MKLSIIVPVYNMASDGKLHFCLDSLIHQSIRGYSQDIPNPGDTDNPQNTGISYEIIAVDDASGDDSLKILREYEKKYGDLIKVIASPVNKRQGGAKNMGLEAATGEWISFIDSDDWVSPLFYEKLLQKAEETGADMVGCDYSLVTEHTFQVGKTVQNNTRDQTGRLDREKHGKLIMRSGSMVIKLYKGDVIRRNNLRFPEDIFYEDNCAGPLWSLYFTHFEKLDEPLYYYYQHESSTVHEVTQKKCEDRMKAGEKLYEECRDRGFLESYFPQIEYRFTELYFVNTLFSYMLGNPHPQLSFVKQLYQGQISYFPDFEKNIYYRELTGEENQKFIQLLTRSPVKFYWYYRYKFWVRGLIGAIRLLMANRKG